MFQGESCNLNIMILLLTPAMLPMSQTASRKDATFSLRSRRFLFLSFFGLPTPLPTPPLHLLPLPVGWSLIPVGCVVLFPSAQEWKAGRDRGSWRKAGKQERSYTVESGGFHLQGGPFSLPNEAETWHNRAWSLRTRGEISSAWGTVSPGRVTVQGLLL